LSYHFRVCMNLFMRAGGLSRPLRVGATLAGAISLAHLILSKPAATAARFRLSQVHQAARLLLLTSAAALAMTPTARSETYYNDVSGGNGTPGETSPFPGHNGGAAPNDAQAGGSLDGAVLDDLASTTGSAVEVIANGGNGGNGGNGNPGEFTSDQNGGDGAVGADGGSISLGFGGRLTTSGGAPTVSVMANGGQGGQGGNPANRGNTGQDGSGGHGGTIQLYLTGSVANTSTYDGNNLAPAAVVLSGSGGDGGANPEQGSDTYLDSSHGNLGSFGGNAEPFDGMQNIVLSTISDDGKTVASSIDSQGPGIVAIAQGGDGQLGGAASGDGAKGGDGGNGGIGGLIYINTATTSITARGVDGHGTWTRPNRACKRPVPLRRGRSLPAAWAVPVARAVLPMAAFHPAMRERAGRPVLAARSSSIRRAILPRQAMALPASWLRAWEDPAGQEQLQVPSSLPRPATEGWAVMAIGST
jgi:hypothetical protein